MAPDRAELHAAERLPHFTAGLDVGLGFGRDQASLFKGGVVTSENLTNYTFDIGVPFVMASTEKAFFFVRPGFVYTAGDNVADFGDPTTDGVINTPTTMGFALDLGVEYFFNDNFSVQVAHGLGFKSSDPDIQGADTSTSFATEDFGISNIGFHYYFK